jgi:hypothetical protein
LGRHVADFAAHYVVLSHFSGEFHFFYPAARSGPGPGLCRARVYSASGGAGHASGEWQGEVFAVAGSVAPLPRPSPAGYRERLEAACAARRDMGFWYRAEAGKAWLAARLADTVVASTRRAGRLTFRLTCRSRPHYRPEQPRCAADVRKAIAAANPRAIVQAWNCVEEGTRPCLTIGLAQFPELGSGAAERQWLLNVRYRDEGELRIERVDVDDIRIKFE